MSSAIPISETNVLALDLDDQKYFPSEKPFEANLPVRAISSYSFNPTTRKPRVYLIAPIPALTIAKIVRYEVGEGMEKKNEDFAAEVAAQMAGN